MAEEQQARGLLLVPEWPASPFTLEVGRRAHQLVLMEKFYPVWESREEIRSKTFKGVSKFAVQIFKFNF